MFYLVFAPDLYDLAGMAEVPALDDHSCQFSAFNTPGVEAHAVFFDSQSFTRIVAVYDGRAFVFGDGFLEFVPWLGADLE